MTAPYVELDIDKGTSFETNVTLTDEASNTPLNLTNTTVRAAMRRSYISPTKTDITTVITNASGGVIKMTLTPTQTTGLKTGRYVFDVEVQFSDGKVIRVLQGMIVVNPEVTY